MKLTHIDNACCIYESQGFKLLCDPWLTDGAFEGSWFHYPPLCTRFADISNSDALYISHLHPDHYDETVLKQFRKDIPIVVLDHGANFLHRKLEGLGFTNIIKVKDKDTITLGPLEVTVYAPFVNHPFDHSDLGNFIDSALVVESNGKTILNANDNTPSEETARMLYEKHGKFNIVQLKDSLAGPYPSCFINLTSEEKHSEVERLVNRQLRAMCNVAKELKAEFFQPFAGDYQLGGRLSSKNQFLGVAGKQYSARFIASQGIMPLLLNEQGSIDLITGELKNTYRNLIKPYQQWLDGVKEIKYPYEKDPQPENILLKCTQASERLSKFQEKFNYYPDMIVHVNNFEFYLGKNRTDNSAIIKFILDPRALAGVLDRRYHWNNLEVGCHIDIERIPNVYDPDLVNAMCWFYV